MTTKDEAFNRERNQYRSRINADRSYMVDQQKKIKDLEKENQELKFINSKIMEQNGFSEDQSLKCLDIK